MVKRKKVMWLIKGLGLGGAEKLLELSLPFLDRSRFDYEVAYMLPWKDALVPAFRDADIPVFCLKQCKSYDLRVLPRLVSLLRQRQVELLHSHLPYAGIMARVASKMAPVRSVVYTEHNLWERYHWLTYHANRLTYGWNDAVVAVSTDVERSIRAHFKENGRTELRTILNGVDVDQLGAIERDPQGVKEEMGIPAYHRLVVHVANFTPKKRHEDLLQAAKMVTRHDPDVTFLLVGQGPLEAEIKEEALRLGLEGNIVFAGFRADAPRLIAAGDLFVLSSQYEGLPVSLLEAMSLGRPTVLTNVGGIPEVVSDGVEGFMVEPLNPAKLAEKILQVLASLELQARFSQNALRRVRDQFGVDKMVRSVESLYESVLGAEVVGNDVVRTRPKSSARM